MFERAGVITTGLAFLALTLAGCAVDDDFENVTGATGTVTFCVQDENNVNFNSIFVNFGNIEINQEADVGTGGADVTDVATDDPGTNATVGANGTTGSPTDATDTDTTAASNGTGTTATETGPATTASGAATDTARPDDGEPARTIQVTDIDCVRTQGDGFDIGDVDARGQAYGNDRTADTNDAPSDDDEGIGNDDGRGRGLGRDEDGETERVNVEADEVDLLRFQGRNAAFLAEAKVKPGTFRNVVIDVESVRVTTDEGDEREVQLDVTKIHLKGPIEVREDQNTLVVFKVDLDRSIVSTASGEVRFKPVLQVQVTAPQVQEIVIQETTTVTTTAANGTMASGSTMTTGATMTTANGTATGPESATATTDATASPTPTATNTTTPSP